MPQVWDRSIGFRASDRPDETVPATTQGFDESRVLRRVSQRLAELPDGRPQAVIEVHEGVGRPQSILELFARYHVAGTLQKYPKDLEWFLLKLHLQAVLAQLTGTKVNVEDPEVYGSAFIKRVIDN